MAEYKTFVNMPVVGSLAYDLERTAPYPERERYREPERKVVIPAPPVADEKVSANAKVRTQQAVSPVALIGFACAAVLLVFTLMAKIQLTAVTDQAVKLESQLSELEMAQSRLLIEYESAFNLTEIEDFATSTLGMQRPREEQIIYLNSSAPNKAVILEDSEDSYGLSDRLYDMLKSIGEYFK